MRLLFLVDPLPGLKPTKDSSIAMMRAAAARGHHVWTAGIEHLWWESGAGKPPPEMVPTEMAQTPTEVGFCAPTVAVMAQPLQPLPPLQAPDPQRGGAAGQAPRLDWADVGAAVPCRVADFDAVLMRKDPPFDLEYITATWLLTRAEAEGARVFNAPGALREHSEKLALAEFAEFAPETLVARDPARLNAFIDRVGDAIVKPLDGMGGAGIFRLRHDDPNRHAILETLGADGANTVMAQRYLPAIAQGDKRILLIDGQAIPYALARIPRPGETRGNLAAGGRGVAQPLSARDRQIADCVGPPLAARGLLLVGLDVIGEQLTEINVTSPTCMVEIAAQTGFDAATAFITALEKRCAAPRAPGAQNPT